MTAFVVLPWAMIVLAPVLVLLIVFSWLALMFFYRAATSYKILIVDDDEVSITPMLLALQRQDRVLAVNHIKDSYEALDTLKKEHFDLMILDYQMPGLCGDELLAAADKSPDVHNQTSVVYYTSDIGFLSTPTNDQYGKFNILDKWAKKINYQSLNHKIESVLVTM